MKNSNQPQDKVSKNREDIQSDKKTGAGAKKNGKTGDAAYNAAQQKNDPSRAGRHAGESEMNDENRSGGSGL
jgi:hypothetical protein